MAMGRAASLTVAEWNWEAPKTREDPVAKKVALLNFEWVTGHEG